MTERMHREDLRAIIAGMLWAGAATGEPASNCCLDADDLLAELERTAKPEQDVDVPKTISEMVERVRSESAKDERESILEALCNGPFLVCMLGDCNELIDLDTWDDFDLMRKYLEEHTDD